MINIPVKTGNKTYYICFMSNDLSNDLGSTAQSYTKITKIINFTLKTISPSDITVSDLKNFNISKNTMTISVPDGSLSYSIDHSHAQDDSLNASYYTVTSTEKTTVWRVSYPAFTGAQLQNLAGLLSTLIKNAHTHINENRGLSKSRMSYSWVNEAGNDCDNSGKW